MKSWPAILLTAFCCPIASAEVVIDQEHLGSCCVGYILDYPEDYIAQTFTVRNDGKLVGAAVQVTLSGYSNYKPVTDDLKVSIMRTNSLGLPAVDQILATQTIGRYDIHYNWDLDNIPMTEVDFSQANLHVHTGDVLAIALSSNHTYYPYQSNVFQYVWKSEYFGTHPGGEFFVYSPRIFGPTPFSGFYIPDRSRTRDQGFRILVEPVPEPSIHWMVAIASALLTLYRRRKFI